MKRIVSMVLLLQLAAHSAAQGTDVVGLSEYAGKDLRKLGRPAWLAICKEAETLTGDPTGRDIKQWRAPVPWRVDRFAVGDAEWVLLEVYPGFDIPDVSSLRIHVFNKEWKRLRKQEFPTGYRMRITEVALAKASPLNQPLVVVTVASTGPFVVENDKLTRPAFEQGNFQKQYYALSGEKFVMVRQEDDEGRIVPNNYRWREPPKGPNVPDRTRDEWIRSLSSKDPIDQLATLVWLSGSHLPSGAPRAENVNQESVNRSEVYQAVRDTPETRKVLRELADSKNAWVQAYANHILHSVPAP
jgi:hypothetical protein